MKRTLFITMLLATFFFVKGQLLFNDSVFVGLSKLQLGDSLSKFDGDIKKITMSLSSYKDQGENTFYQYSPALQHPIEIANIKFYTVMCSFDTDGNLVGLCLSKWPRSEHFTRAARKHYKQLIDYMTNALHEKGRRKIYYPQVHEAYEWTKGPTTVEVNIQQTGEIESTSIGITLHLNKAPSIVNNKL